MNETNVTQPRRMLRNSYFLEPYGVRNAFE